MSKTVIDKNFISDMLISQQGTINQDHPVGNWWFNSSLGNIKNNNYGYNLDNLTEVLWKIERGISDFNIIPKIKHCDYRASSIAYDAISKNKIKYWNSDERAYRAIRNSFHMPIEYFEEFCQIIADSINTVYLK